MTAKLTFTNPGANEGFRPSSISTFSNVDPDTIFRELLQNAVDASSNRRTTQVRIEFEQVKKNELTFLEDYEDALEKAKDTQSRLGTLDNARYIVNDMESCLRSSLITTLWVTDNGRGLCPEHMSRLLSDGQSAKCDAYSTGAYGNGHMTVFPASKLRFLLYGGVYHDSESVKRIYSGHSILASRQLDNPDQSYGKDGYLVAKLTNDLFNRFEFSEDTNAVLPLDRRLDVIQRDFETGSCVGILGFNGFGRDINVNKTVEIIERVVAVHFLPLVFNNELTVQIFDNGSELMEINSHRVKEILDRTRERARRIKNSVGPSGKQSWMTLCALERGSSVKIDTELGAVDCKFLMLDEITNTSDGGTTIQLFRNGMWITNDIPRCEPGKFRDRKSFVAVLLLDPESASQACELIRALEGPCHSDLVKERLGSDGQVKARADNFFKCIHNYFYNCIPKLETEEFDPGFFRIPLKGRGKGGKQGNNGSKNHRVKGRNAEGNGQINRRGRNRVTPHPLPFRFTEPLDAKISCVRNEDILSILVYPRERANRAGIYLRSMVGVDSTCDNPVRSPRLSFGRNVEIASDRTTEILYPNDSSHDKQTIDALEIGPIHKGVEFSVQLQFNGDQALGVEAVVFRTNRVQLHESNPIPEMQQSEDLSD